MLLSACTLALDVLRLHQTRLAVSSLHDSWADLCRTATAHSCCSSALAALSPLRISLHVRRKAAVSNLVRQALQIVLLPLLHTCSHLLCKPEKFRCQAAQLARPVHKRAAAIALYSKEAYQQIQNSTLQKGRDGLHSSAASAWQLCSTSAAEHRNMTGSAVTASSGRDLLEQHRYLESSDRFATLASTWQCCWQGMKLEKSTCFCSPCLTSGWRT